MPPPRHLRAALVAGVCLLCGCASMTTAERAYIGASVADIGTTAAGLSRGLEEQNPILRGGSDGETLARAVVLNAAGIRVYPNSCIWLILRGTATAATVAGSYTILER